MRRLLPTLFTTVVLCVLAPPALGAVLTVGTYHGVRGQYTSLQTAVNAAQARRLDPGRAR